MHQQSMLRPTLVVWKEQFELPPTKLRKYLESITADGFEVWNKSLFTFTDAYDCFALLHRDGKLVQEKKLDGIAVTPESRAHFPLPFMVPAVPG